INVLYDDVEVVNPLGSKTKKHKLGVFCYTLGNIRPINRSQLKAIQLLVVVKRTLITKLITKYGVNTILEPIMTEIAELEKDGGYQFFVNGEEKSFSGTFAFVSGDNLASQELAGFKFDESQFTLRTPQNHDDQCEEILGDDTLSTTYGVKFASALCQSRYFHVFQIKARGLILEQLVELKNLKDGNVVNNEEFEEQKKKMLEDLKNFNYLDRH
ncbi:hypothetical protein QZH41_012508, partial [Actinostola sp. cb2023]